MRKPSGRSALGAVACALCFTFAVAGPAPAKAESPDEAARQVLKSMTDYVSKLDTVSLDFSADLEALSTKGFKLQFPASGQMTLDRPNKFRITREGGHSDIELVSDGETVTLYGRGKNAYAQNNAPDSFDAFVDMAREKRGMDIPGADLFLSNAYEVLMDPVTEAMYLGTGVVDGVECDHLAFRTPDVDWQIWVAKGGKPYPCKYVVTSKWTTAAPEYSLRVRNWNDSPKLGGDSFAFEPADGAKKVDLSDIDASVLLPETLKKGAQ